MKTKFACALALAALTLSVFAEEDGGSPKGIFVDPGATPTRNGVAYRIMLLRGDMRQEVPVSFGFRSGDRFRLQLDLKDSAYVYVLNRTFNGKPKEMGDKGIEVVRDEDRNHHAPVQSTYTLLYPGPGEQPAKISAGRYHDIPEDAALRMDHTPGIEKLYIILSDHPLDLPKLFVGGRLREGALEKVNQDLCAWAADTRTEGPAPGANDINSKGIERDTYTVGRRTKPIMAEISLHHFPS